MQMESLPWCLGQLGPVRPLGSTLRLPEREERYASALPPTAGIARCPS